MELTREAIDKSLPFYLTAEDKRVLVKELEDISRGGNPNYYLSKFNDKFPNEMLQGDGWHGFNMFLHDSGDRRSVRGIVLSNSCDIDPDNKRDYPTRVVFAPIIRLSSAENLLKREGISPQKINDQLSAIRAQKNTSCFYLPKNEELEDECLVRLDDIHSIPISSFYKNKTNKKLFTLSNTGFYMLVLKLSVHFCRLQEKVRR